MFIRKLFKRVEDIFTKRNDPDIWSRELERHYAGSYSYACVRARPGPQLEFSHVEIGPIATFIGIYDGHNGPDVASYAYENLFSRFIGYILDSHHIHQVQLTQAVNDMETQIIQQSEGDQRLAAVGSCCLAVLIYQNHLYVRNLGDGKCVIGITEGDKIVTDQVNNVDDLLRAAARNAFKSQHPEEDAIVEESGVYRIKGKVKVTKSLGDACLKYDNCAIQAPVEAAALLSFHFPEPTSRPYLSGNLAIAANTTRDLNERHKFVIIASNGLWDFLSNEDAKRIVQSHPKEGIARILIQEAQKVAARRRPWPYKDLRNFPFDRDDLHDDMTVVVVFLNSKKLKRRNDRIPMVSVRAHSQNNEQSRFAEIHQYMQEEGEEEEGEEGEEGF